MQKMVENDAIRSDEALVLRFQRGDAAAADRLIETYKQTVRAQARALYLAGGDRDDLLQEGMLGLFKAIQTWQAGKTASFRTYATICVNRQMYSAIRQASRKKHEPLNGSVSLHELTDRREPERTERDGDPERILIGRESARLLTEQIEETLSPYERRVLVLYLDGMDYRAIARAVGRSDKSADNALQRIRKKIKRKLQERGEFT